MSSAAPRLATYQDLFDVGDDVRAEILAGEIAVSPAPLPKHAKAQGAIRRFIGGPFDDDDGFGGPGGWWIFAEVDVRFAAHDIVRPDLAGWRRKRLSDPGDCRPIDIVPDWVCEVLSPSTAARDKVEKRKLYAAHGVRHDWIVDADARTVEAFELIDGRWTLVASHDDSSTAAILPFEAIELTIARLFLPRGPGEDAADG